MESKRILVTGVSGFIGHAIAVYLNKCGYEVTGVCRRNLKESDIRSIQLDLSSKFELNETFDVIVHAAGEVPKRTSEQWCYEVQDFNRFKRNNVDTIENLLEFAKTQSVSRIIYLSSIAVFGQFEDEIIDEDSKRINQDAYGLTKYTGEMLLKACKDIEGISLRMPGVIGPGMKNVWLANIAAKLKNNEDITIYTPDFQTKNFVWIDDLTAFVRHLIELDKWKYDTLVLACKESASIRQIVEKIREHTNSNSKISVDNSQRQPFCLNASRAFEMGYESLSPLEIVNKICVR